MTRYDIESDKILRNQKLEANAGVAAARLNMKLKQLFDDVQSEVEYTGNIGMNFRFRIEFECHAESFLLRASYYEEIEQNGFKIESTYINWPDKRFVIRFRWLPRYVRPQTDAEREEAMRMTDYEATKATTLTRYMRVMVRTVIDLQEIGFSKKIIGRVLEVVSEGIVDIMAERKDG